MKTLLVFVLLFTGSFHSAGVTSDQLSPNRSRTPGAINPAVTQANIHRTICVPGYTATIRPPSSYTTGLKISQLNSGYAVNGDKSTSSYEEDHLISLELGGAPSDPKNLWPEYYNSSWGARVKDNVENTLHRLVCSGIIKLKTAQKWISTDWQGAYRKFVGILPKFTWFKKKSSNAGTTNNPPKSSNGLDPRFATCKAANAAGYGPYFQKTDTEYGWYRDANSDGKVC